MRTDSTAIAGVAMGEARDVIGERFGASYTMPQGPRLQDQGEGCPGGARVDPADERSRAIPTRSPAHLKPDELRLYRLIWQRALASQMAPKELETTTVELADGHYRAARVSATETLFDGFARVYTEGRDDDAPRRRRRRSLPRARRG